jgi:hypothetical protein
MLGRYLGCDFRSFHGRSHRRRNSCIPTVFQPARRRLQALHSNSVKLTFGNSDTPVCPCKYRWGIQWIFIFVYGPNIHRQ